MLRLRLDRGQFDPEQLRPAIEAIHSGGVVAFPTDTLYGLAVDPRSKAAIEKLYSIKQRSPLVAVPLIAESTRQVIDHVGTLTPLAEKLAQQFWPGPLTLVIPASSELCEAVHRGTRHVAVRVPDHLVARELARLAGHAITSTSANLSGAEPASSADEVWAALGDQIDVLIDSGPTPGGLPSTVIDVTGNEPKLVRAGAIPWEHVLKFPR